MYFYDGNLLIAERSRYAMVVYMYDNMNSPVGFNVVLFESPRKAEAEGRTYWYKKNLQGEIIGLYSATGQEVATYLYDPYGNIISKNINSSETSYADYNRLFYRGYYYDNDLGLYYLGSRYYDANIGRFISPDDIGYLGANGDINAYNLYAYCSNNPVMFSDPTGHFTIGVYTQFAVSLLSYICFAIASIFDEGIRSDMNAIGWNPFNTNATVAIDSNKISFYQGVPVFKLSGNRPGSFCTIFLTENSSETTVKHEYGHCIQQLITGPGNHALMILLPSWQNWSSRDYYDRPWEVTADIFGNVTEREHSKKDINRGYWYLGISYLFGPLGYLFLIGEY